MLFNSLSFFLFVPIVLAAFSLVPPARRWAVLLVASYVFYALGDAASLLWLGAVTAIVLGCGLGIRETQGKTRVAILAGGLILILGTLVAFKFFDFFAGEIERLTSSSLVLPRLGIGNPVGFSFYAFAAASYLIDAYRGLFIPSCHAGHTALYIAYFPKILAGPIERAGRFQQHLDRGPRLEPDRFVAGMQLIVWGLFKKVVIADNLAPLVDRNFAIAAYASPMELAISVYFFAFQIYCDFSGYTDIAIGVSRLFGIDLMQNFRRPYLARSVNDFWSSRWHISLAQWFRDYLYIPLGGSRAGPVRHYLNVMLVFVVSGLWHAGLGYGVGWTFLVWGALNGLYQWLGIATRLLRAKARAAMPSLSESLTAQILSIIITFHLIAFSWIFFRAESIADAVIVIRKIAGLIPNLVSLVPRYPFTSEHAFGAALISLLIGVEILDERRAIWLRLAAAPLAVRWATYYAGIFGLLILGSWQAEQFIYMQF